MYTGTKDRIIDINTYTTSTGDFGESITSNTPFYNDVWAEIIYASGDERNEGESVTALNEVSFIINYMTGITEKMVVVYDNKNYDILHIEVIGRERELKLKCEKRSNDNVIRR